MGIREALRKAASLLVELPPEEPSVETGSSQGNQSAAPTASSTTVDSFLAGLENDAPPTPTGNAGARTVEDLVRDSDGPSLEAIKIAGPPPATAPDGTVDFPAIYRQAGLPEVPYAAEQALELLNSLPPDLPLEVRRQMVKASLNSLGRTIGVTPDTLVTDASRKVAALNAYVEGLTRRTQEEATATEAEITALETQIRERRERLDRGKRLLEAATRRCESESHRLDDVLEFFSLDVPPSKYAPP